MKTSQLRELNDKGLLTLKQKLELRARLIGRHAYLAAKLKNQDKELLKAQKNK